jgi:tRNA U34 5-methylaminomethyl-2-thiouridine-forming methyltransferase MnmC
LTEYFSKKYNDIYFTPADPESEKQFVFIEANRIGERARRSERFVVAELGFGFGLNCALTFAAAKHVNAEGRLEYYSVDEAFPEPGMIRSLQEHLRRCDAEYETLWNLADQGGVMKEITPRVRSGSVWLGSVHDFLATANFGVDAWYFDGFSPAKNGAMWSEEVFARAFALTKTGGTFSTYSSAGWVRRNLLNAGFIVEKISGYDSKREMLTGYRP